MTTKKSKGHPDKAAAKIVPAPEGAVPKTKVADITLEQQIVGATFLGKIKNHYSKLHVFALTLEAPLAVGDTIRVKGHTTDLTQKVEHMQVEHLPVQSAAAGESVAVQVADLVRPGDAVYKV